MSESVSPSIVENQHERTKEKQIVPLWSLTVWFVVMNTTMFNVTLPSIMQDFNITPAEGSWVVSGYSIILALSTVTFSRFSDYVPISNLLTIGLVILGSASIFGFMANKFYLLLLARLLQAAGAGAISGLAIVFVGKYIPSSRRGKSMAMIASASSLGFGLGPVVGGAITQWLSWNFLFVMTSLVFFLLPLFRRTLPIGNRTKVKFDVLGGFFIGLGVTSLLLFFTSYKYAYLIVSVISFFVLWRHIQHMDIPFIQPSLLKNRKYFLILFISFSVYLTHFATLFLIPIMLSNMFTLDSAMVGLILFPGAILSAIAATFIGKMIVQFGNILIILLGLLAFVLSTLMLSLLSGVSPYIIMISYIIMSLGFSALTSSLTNENAGILLEEELGAGMGTLKLTQYFGGAFGVSISGALIKLQQGIIPEFIYRNTYFVISVLLIFSILTVTIYATHKKRAET